MGRPIGWAQPEPAPKPCEAVRRPLTTDVAIGARPVRRGAVLLDERTRGGARVYGRVCTCPEVYLSMPNVLGVHVVTVLTAVARVGDKRARIGMMTIFSCRVNSTVTSEWGVLH